MKKLLLFFSLNLCCSITLLAQCDIDIVDISNVSCDNNGTPNDPVDDLWEFIMTVSGTQTGGAWIADDPNNTIGFYDDPTTMGFYPIAAGAINLTVTDSADPNCTATTTVQPPAICSNGIPCSISPSFNGNIICNDNGTPADPSDDTWTTEVVVSGTNLGNNGWIANDPLSSSGNYNVTTTLGPYLIANGSFQISFQDVDDPNCESITVTLVPPAPCSNGGVCDLSVIGGAVICDNGGTPGDPSDDTFFQNIVVSNGGAPGNWVADDPNNSSGIYDISQTVGPYSATGGDLTITFTDANDPSCSTTYTIPNPCATSVVNCDLTNPGLGFTTCNDNGTPNDPSDDFYTFPLNPVGTGLGSGYTVTVSAGTVSPPGGNYGSETTFTLTGVAPPLGISVIVTDNDDPNCTTNTIINLPPPCSNGPACDINFAQIGNVTCGDNGTPNDPSDDTFTFILQVVGTGTSPNGWTTSDPLTTTGQYDVVTTMGPYPISAGGFTVVATDNDDPNCSTIPVNIVPPAPCSATPPCNLTGSGISNISCVENGTPGDPSDDYASFTLNPIGSGLGDTYSVSIFPGTITPQQGNYGFPNSFITGPGSASLGDFTITITDNDDPNCTFTFPLTNPCTGVANCSITDVDIGFVNCVDNGTPSDPSDDYILFSLSPNGTGLGDTYLVSSPAGAISPNQGTYGTMNFQTFQAPIGTAGAGDLQITVTDANNPNCTFTLTIPDPGSCSNTPACNLTDLGQSPTVCDDNGTPGDPSDDIYTFTLNPQGTGLGSGYSVTASTGNFSPTIGTYGAPTTFTFSAPAGSTTSFFVTDNEDSNCILNSSVFAEPCPLPPCDIQNAGLSAVACNDAGTPSDDTDDFITFNLNPTGLNLGSQYQITASFGNITPSTALYGTISSFQTSPGTAGNGPITLTITDVNDPSCSLQLILADPGTCSNTPGCTITDAGVISVTCDDAGTPSNPADDFVVLELFPIGVTLGSGYSLSSPDVTVTPANGAYGVTTVFQLQGAATAGSPISLTITDLDHPTTCFLDFTIDNPAPCAVPCDIQAVASVPVCSGNDTPTIPGDDVFTVDITVTGTGSGWQANDPANTNGAFGQTASFGPFPISGGPVAITVSSIDDPSCQETIVIDPPAPCSNLCDIQPVVGTPVCDDNGTPTDPADDVFTTEITVNGSGTGWQADGPASTSGNFGESVIFGPYSISGGPVAITFSTTGNPACEELIIIDPPSPCSDACSLEADVVDTQCDDNGTPATTSDDTYTATIVVTGTNAGSGWTAGPPANTSGIYSNATVVGPFSTAQSEATFTITDNDDSLCNITFSIPSTGGCSSGCPEPDSTFLADASCNPLDTGVQVVTLTNTIGCDSLVITTTALLPSDTTFINEQSCNPADTGTVETLLVNEFGCDSLVVTTTTLLPSDTTLIELESCNPADTGTVEELLANEFGCDSLVVTTTTLLPSDTTLISLESCNPVDTGTVEELLVNEFGCDSLVITTTTLLPSDTTLINLESCNPADTGTVETVLSNQFGCDSLVITTTTLLPSDSTIIELTSCNPADTGRVEELLANEFGCDSLVITTTSFALSDTTLVAGQSCNPLDTGTIETLLSNQFGCDSLVITTTILLPFDTTFVSLESCNPLDTGTVEELLPNEFGCDSLVITTTTLLPSDTTFVSLESCNPADTGTVEELLSNELGCDSLVITTTTLLPSDTIFVSLESCNPADTGTVEELLANEFGCDSLVITTTTLLPSDTTFVNLESCNPADTGTVEELLSNEFGCDSLVVTTTTLLPSDTTFVSLESCNPLDTGMVEELLVNEFGCDSLVVTTTALLPSDTTFVSLESCNPVDTGTVEELLSNEFGCDSLVVTTTTLLPSDTTFINLESCNPSDTGTVEELLSNEFGCDSLVVTTTTLLPSDTTFVNLESCNPVDTGTVEELLSNEFGCDSLVVTTTTLLPSDTTQLFAESCNPQDTGTTQVLLQNQDGCDSLVITTTTLLPIPSINLTPTICFGDSITINGTIYVADNPSGIDTLTAASGCDSLVFVELQILTAPEVQQIDTVLCTGEQLVVNGQVYDEGQPTGTQVISGQNGCDSLQINITATFNDVQLNAQAEPPACEGLPGRIVLESATGGSPPYSYSLNGQGGKPIDTLPLILEGLFPGEYSLQLTDGIGCTQEQNLSVAEGPTPAVELGADLTAVLGADLFLNPSINFAYDSLVWSPSEAVSCDGCLNPAVTATESLTISLLAYDLQGCEAEDDIRILVDRRSSVYAPNIFSPNDDGRNDYFTLFADLDQVASIRRLAIFDRWGNQVFEGAKLTPNVEPQGWDGRYKGERMDPAVFVFFAEVEFVDGRMELIEGNFTLLR